MIFLRTKFERRNNQILCDAQAFFVASAFLFDHLVGELLKVKWDIEAKRLCSLKIYYQLEFGGLLDWQIGGHDPIEDLSTQIAARR